MLETVKKWAHITNDALMAYGGRGTEVTAKGNIISKKLKTGEKINVDR